MKKTVTSLKLGSALIALAAFATPAFAQDEPAPVSTVSEDDLEQADSGSADQNVTVTARRTEESAAAGAGRRSPRSTSARSSESRRRTRPASRARCRTSTSCQGRGSSNATNIFIRGIGQPDALQTFDPAVGVYVDGVYFSRIRGTQFDLLDLERVEVLRGPQGTLYGKNTIGGALELRHPPARPGAARRGHRDLRHLRPDRAARHRLRRRSARASRIGLAVLHAAARRLCRGSGARPRL